jgi:hypothetical protein
MSTLKASKEIARVLTDNFSKPLRVSGYGLMQPKEGYHLEVTVKVVCYDYYYFEKFYFPEGNYNPEIVEKLIKEAEYHVNSEHLYGDYVLFNHQYIPVWDGVFPVLKSDEWYYVTFITNVRYNWGYYFDWAIKSDYIEGKNDDVLAVLKSRYDDDQLQILSVTAINPYLPEPKDDDSDSFIFYRNGSITRGGGF